MAKEQTSEIKNEVTIENIGPCKKKIIIEVPQEAITAAADKQYESLRKEVVLPGFRKGRAPRRLLEKRFGKETSDQIKLQLLSEAGDAAVKDNNLNILRDPDIDYEKIELPVTGSMKFEFEVEVRPDFDLPNLEGIPVEKTIFEVTKESIDGEIEQLRVWSGLWTPKDEDAIELNNQIIADVILKAENAESEEKLNNIEVYVRPHGAVGAIQIEKLDELLLGAKVGQTKKTTIEVPRTYFKEEYRGKKVDIQITIKDIKWLKPAELNQDFFNHFGVADENELREKITESLKHRLENQSREQMSQQIYKYMLDNTNFDLPMDVVADQATGILQRQYTNLLRQGIPTEKLVEQMEQLRAGSEEQAKEQLKAFFIMDKVADKLKIDVAEEEINGHIAQVAHQRGQRPEKMKDAMMRDGSLSQFRLQVREDKCITKLLESAKITEVKEVKSEKKAEKATKTEKPAKKSVEKTAGKPAKTSEKPAKKEVSDKKKTPAKDKKTTKKKTKE
jgi:trigger factor